MGKSKQKKKTHDQHIDELEEKVKGNYQIIMKNVPYFSPDSEDMISDMEGDLDLLGICGRTWHIYEVKTGDDPKTAAKQLERAKSALSNCAEEIKTFYYSGKTKEIKQVK